MATYPILMHEEIEKGLKKKSSEINALFVTADQTKEEEEDVTPPTGELQVSEVLSIKNGFGFVKYPNNNLFFHQLDVIGDFLDLSPGDTVEFIIEKNQLKQDVAKNVRKISGGRRIPDSEVEE